MRLGIMIITALIGAGVSQTGFAADERVHIEREDFAMNSVGGGDFRSYVSEQITDNGEPAQWRHSMQTLGVLHNLMHEMMTDLALYGQDAYPDADLPEFDLRISGGQWTDYQQALTEAYDADHPWRQFAHVMEVMHDRVHHVMVNAIRFDIDRYARDTELSEYASESRTPHDEADTLPPADQLRFERVDQDQLRDYIWHGNYKNPHLHAALQKLITFDYLIRDLQTQWLNYANHSLDESCHYQLEPEVMSIPTWQAYAKQTECSEAQWTHLVTVTDLMQQRVNHMAAALMREQGEI